MDRLPDRRSNQTLSTKLKWANLVTSGTVILLSTLFLLGIQIYFFTSALVSQTQAQATMASENMSAAMVFNDPVAANDILAALRVAPDVQWAVVYDRHQQLFASYLRDDGAAHGRAPANIAKDYDLSYQYVTVVEPLIVKRERLGTVVVRSRLDSVYRQLALYLALTIPVMLSVLAIAHLVLSRLQRFITDPILALSNVSAQISRLGDYSIRAQVSSLADIGMLSKAFNTMLDRIENVSQTSVASLIAEKCLAKLAQPIAISGHEIHIGASIGISVYPDHASNMHELLKYADTAMYYAKNNGKNGYRLFAPSMQEDARKRFTIDNNLRRALERDEFVLHFQPQIDLRSGAICGAEALIR